MSKKINDFEKRVNDVEKRKLKLDEEIQRLLKLREDTQTNHATLEESYKRRVAELQPQHIEKMTDYEKHKNELDHMKTHSIEMDKKMVDMGESKKVIGKQIEKFDEEIGHISVVLEEVTVKHKESNKLDTNNKASLDFVNNQIKKSQREHQEYLKSRSDYLRKLREQLDSNIELNRKLASRYRCLKYDFFDEKLHLLRQIDMGLSEHLRLKDKRQVKSLQSRMHMALSEYFRLRIKYSQNCLGKLSVSTNENGDHILQLEGHLFSSVNNITYFLENQMDFNKVRQQAMEKVRREELIEENAMRESKLSSASSNRSSEGIQIPNSVSKAKKEKKIVKLNLVNVN